MDQMIGGNAIGWNGGTGLAHFSGVSQSPKIALPNPWRQVK